MSDLNVLTTTTLCKVPCEAFPVFWVLGTMFAYAAAGIFLILVLEGLNRQKIWVLGASIGAIAVAILVFKCIHGPRPIKYGIASALAAGILLIVLTVWSKCVNDWRDVKRRKEYSRKVILHLVLLTGSAVFILPFVWLVTTSFKEEDQIFKYPPVWIPRRHVMMKINGKKYGLYTMHIGGQNVKVMEVAELVDGSKRVRVLEGTAKGKEMNVTRASLTKVRKIGLKWENYAEALDFLPPETRKGLLYLWNTVYITALSILGTLLSSSLVAYSFARLRWPGRDSLFVVLLATMMLPAAVTMIPVFLIFRTLGWVDTLRPLWVPSFFGGAFSVFLLRQFFMTIPTDLEDAAKIDGCSYFGIYWRIMLPLIKPALAALTIMTFMGSWNNFMGPLIYINSPEKMPLSYALALFQGAHGAEYGLLMAASTLVMLPVLLVFFFTQRYFIQGITLTGMKQ